MEMAGHRQRCYVRDHPPESALDRRRLAIADRIGEDDRIGTGFGDLHGDVAYPILVYGTLDRAAEGGGEPAGDARPPLGRGGVAERHDAAEILDRLSGGAAHIRAIVTLADRQHEIHLVHAERQATFSTSEVWDQRRYGEPGQGERVT